MQKIRLPDAKFELLDCNKCPIMCIKTDCEGVAVIDHLPLGRYFLREIEAPCGYEKSCELVEICIDEKDCHRCVEFVNKRKTGSIKIVKYGADFC